MKFQKGNRDISLKSFSGGGNGRLSNFELLRVLCMCLIICGHIMMVHSYDDFGDVSWLTNQSLKPFCIIAVNTFVLISGYWGINLKWGKLLSINWMVTFYSIAFLIISIVLDIHTYSPTKDWMYLLPVITKKYWFITIYFALCIISPYLNILVEHIDTGTFRYMLFVCFCIFVILPTVGYVFNFPGITEDAGYGIVNFSFLYLLGRYLRLHHSPKLNKYWYLFGYFVCAGCCSVFHIVYSKVLGFTFDSLLSYNTIFAFCGSLCFFLFFSQLHFRSYVINKLAQGCLAAYVMHMHPLFYDYFFKDVLKVTLFNGMPYIGILFAYPIAIYLGCMLIETVRLHLLLLIKK